MKNTVAKWLILLVVILAVGLICVEALDAMFNFGIFHYLFASDANSVNDLITDYVGDLNRPLLPETTLFLPWELQALVGVVLIVIAVIFSKFDKKNQKVRKFLMLLAVITCIRHLVWRALFTIDVSDTANTVIGIILYTAEFSAFGAMLLGYFQMFHPKGSQEIPIDNIPEDKLPSVDVYITTYNESCDVLYRSIVGARSINYANKKVYILDDGRRAEVRDLCARLGCEYLSRDNNEHAKAGNLNEAMKHTTGELIAIFDADHVATTNFLKRTVGFFTDNKVAYVQTPQHFFTPDPFQRNLIVERAVSNEQDLFYHVVQPGNNYWGSTFFAGSGAIFRRSALELIGGFATETITEDTHTGIRLHARGFKSHYVNKDLAAGLAQDSFMDYLTQRLRWGRGMSQILRHDNPLFIRGLKFPQRLCYFSGIYYFFNGLPRLMFLFAPLCFLWAGLKPIDAGIVEMCIYYIPTFTITMMTFGFVTNGIRQTFWSEVYDTATSLFLGIETTIAVLFPFKARFRVTPKGSISNKTSFNWNIVFPQLILAVLTLAGITIGIIRMFKTPEYVGGILPNIFWSTYNLFILVGAVIVASNRPQFRAAPRIFRKVRCELKLNDGTYAIGYTTNVSETGVALVVDNPVPVSEFLTVTITDPEINLSTTVTGEVIRSEVDQSKKHYIGIKVINRTEQQHIGLVRHMYTAESVWHNVHARNVDTGNSYKTLLGTLFRWSKTEEAPLLRVAPRFNKQLKCVLMLNEPMSLSSSEISETGMSLILPYKMNIASGTPVSVRIQWDDQSISEVECTVMRIFMSRLGPQVGLRFTNVSTEFRTQIINHIYEQAGKKLRVAPTFSKVLSCLVVESEKSAIPGYTYEISETGACIAVQPLENAPEKNVKLVVQWEDEHRQEIPCKITDIYDNGDCYLLKMDYEALQQNQRKELISKLYAPEKDVTLYPS